MWGVTRASRMGSNSAALTSLPRNGTNTMRTIALTAAILATMLAPGYACQSATSLIEAAEGYRSCECECRASANSPAAHEARRAVRAERSTTGKRTRTQRTITARKRSRRQRGGTGSIFGHERRARQLEQTRAKTFSLGRIAFFAPILPPPSPALSTSPLQTSTPLATAPSAMVSTSTRPARGPRLRVSSGGSVSARRRHA